MHSVSCRRPVQKKTIKCRRPTQTLRRQMVKDVVQSCRARSRSWQLPERTEQNHECLLATDRPTLSVSSCRISSVPVQFWAHICSAVGLQTAISATLLSALNKMAGWMDLRRSKIHRFPPACLCDVTMVTQTPAASPNGSLIAPCNGQAEMPAAELPVMHI